MNPKTFEYNEYVYSFNQKDGEIDFKIESGKECPDVLYKYYSLNKNSINSLLNNYLFSSHPQLLNDKHDCSSDLIDYSNLKLTQYIEYLVIQTKLLEQKDVISLFNTKEHWKLDKEVKTAEQIRLFMKFGIISLTTKEDNILMWAYYSQNSGFALKFKVAELPENFYGAFPINYSNEYKTFNYSFYGPILSILYQTNIKSNYWKIEDEWRFLTYNENGSYHPFHNPNDLKSRYFYYSKESVQEIILGYNFFDLRDFSEVKNDYKVVKFKPENLSEEATLKIKLLDFIFRNNIPCKQIVRSNLEFKLIPMKIEIKQIDMYTFIIKEPF